MCIITNIYIYIYVYTHLYICIYKKIDTYNVICVCVYMWEKPRGSGGADADRASRIVGRTQPERFR